MKNKLLWEKKSSSWRKSTSGILAIVHSFQKSWNVCLPKTQVSVLGKYECKSMPWYEDRLLAEYL